MARYYYYVKPLIPRQLQLSLRRWVATRKRQLCHDIWPIDREAGTTPDGWRGWPGNKRFALVLTHDVDTFKGHEKCDRLLKLEKNLGFRSSFNFVAAEYPVCGDLRRRIQEQNFEVGLHGLVHSRKLYESRAVFKQHAAQINNYLKAWDAIGFRSPCMYHNLDWIHDLNISYDASTFDTDPFEPQPDGMKTIFPFTVKSKSRHKSYVELPYTLPQDFTLFILFQEKNTAIWEKKLDWLAEKGGMALLNTHPDYMSFNGKPSREEYPSDYYEKFLQLIASKYKGQFWHALPCEMAKFWSKQKDIKKNCMRRADLNCMLPKLRVLPDSNEIGEIT